MVKALTPYIDSHFIWTHVVVTFNKVSKLKVFFKCSLIMQILSLWLQALTWLHPTSLQQCCFTLHEGEYKVNTQELLHWQSSKNISITSLSSVMSTECGTGTSSERWNRIQSAYYAHQKLAHNLTFMESWVCICGIPELCTDLIWLLQSFIST